MSGYTVAQSMPSHCRMAATLASMAAAMMLGACAQSGENLTSMLGSPAAEKQVAEADAGGGKSSDNRTELEKATEYWGKKYKEKPSDKEAGLSYAKNLRAMGEKRQALAVMQQLAMFYGHDKDVASEYGRLALEMDQIGIAKQMLAVADDPGKPDWRVISAKGTILAKEGKFTDAIPLFERAMTLAPDQTSVMNNLAMAYAMGGAKPPAPRRCFAGSSRPAERPTRRSVRTSPWFSVSRASSTSRKRLRRKRSAGRVRRRTPASCASLSSRAKGRPRQPKAPRLPAGVQRPAIQSPTRMRGERQRTRPAASTRSPIQRRWPQPSRRARPPVSEAPMPPCCAE